MDEHKYWLVWKYPKKHIIDFIAPFYTQQQALDSMFGWWQKNGYTPPYVRMSHAVAPYPKNNTFRALWIDYGHHDMFYEVWETPHDFEPFRIHTGSPLKTKTGKLSRFSPIRFIDSLYLKSMLKEGIVFRDKNGLMFHSVFGRRLTTFAKAMDLINNRQQSAYVCMRSYQEKTNDV